MKKISTIAVFILFALSTSVFAQESYQVYVHDVKTDKPSYQVGETINGQFDVSNLSSLPVSDVYYTISIGEYSDSALDVFNLTNTTSKQGPLYVQSRAKETLSYSYQLPQTISGEAGLTVTAYLKDGTFIGQGFATISITGVQTKERALIMDASLFLVDEEMLVDAQMGPVIYEEEEIEFVYSIAETTQPYTLIPTVTIYNRTNIDSQPVYTQTLEPIITSDMEETDYAILLPNDLDPLVYYGVVSFDSSDLVEIDSVDFRYIIAGPIATIRNITTETLSVKQNQEFSATVFYGGQPFDELREIEIEDDETYTLTVEAKNENGVAIAQTSTVLDMNQEVVHVSFVATEKAEALSFSATITNSNNDILSSYQTNLPTYKDISHQEKYSTAQKISLYTIISFIILVLIIVAIIYLRKNHAHTIPSLMILMVGVAGSTFVFGIQDAKAWEVILLSGASNTNQNFAINAVVSPLPPEIKSYAPGERFNFTYAVSYGDCNNEGQRYRAYSYKEGIEWWNENPATATSQSIYWNEKGKELLNGNAFNLAQSVYQVDLVRQIDVSEQVQGDLRSLLTIFGGKVDMYRINERGSSPIYDGAGIRIDQIIEGYRGRTLYVNPQFVYDDRIKLFLDESYNDYLEAKFWDGMQGRGGELNSVKTILSRNGYSDSVYSSFNFADQTGLSYQTATETYQIGRNTSTRTIYTASSELKEYYEVYLALMRDVSLFANPHLARFAQSVPTAEKAHPKVHYTFSEQYTAPTTPGFHTIHGYVSQSANSGFREALFAQEICVTGAGLCPNEDMTPQLCSGLTGTITQSSDGTIFQDGEATEYVINSEGSCVLPTPSCDTSRIEGDTECVNGILYAWTCTSTGWQQVEIGTCGGGSGSYCQASTSGTTPNTPVTFTAYPSGASYEWLDADGTTISTDRTITQSFSSTGLKTMRVSIDETVHACSVTIETSITPPDTQDPITSNPDDVYALFRFNPDIAGEPNNTCRFETELTQEELALCTFANRTIQYKGPDLVNGIGIRPGLWTLTCGDEEVTRQCTSNPSLNEN